MKVELVYVFELDIKSDDSYQQEDILYMQG